MKSVFILFIKGNKGQAEATASQTVETWHHAQIAQAGFLHKIRGINGMRAITRRINLPMKGATDVEI